ncbi:MAG: hypothetical protein OFPII_36610 [Osedax symbiont Rs1]|nr:MAG: hypothetical protein OFPII_36610 [Osedax symbiont Rs1]
MIRSGYILGNEHPRVPLNKSHIFPVDNLFRGSLREPRAEFY